MPENQASVVISGAGPNGLMLACELALAGIRPVVLELLPGPSDEPKANGLVGQVIRSLDIRGLYQLLGGPAGPPQPMYAWLFAGMRVPLTGVADNPMSGLPIPQPRLVRLLADRAQTLGAEIRWGSELTRLQSRDDAIVLEVATEDGSYELESTYLVGADGGRSLVRKTVGMDFPGFTAETVGRLAHVQVPQEMRAPDGGIDIPGFGHLPPMHNRLERGTVIFAQFEPGRQLIGTVEMGDGPVADDEPMTLDELRSSLVFLVGDAAHVHSAMGGPGLNLGLQDAMNLGWKLAAAVNGWAPAGLLDTYHDERYPVGERVMMQSMSQTALMLPGPETTALRTLFAELLHTRDGAAHVAHLLAGSDVRYDVGGDHPLAGRFMPESVDATLLHNGRSVLLDASGGAITVATQRWSHRVDCVSATSADEAACGMLIRPDGYIAWAADVFEDDDERRLRAALQRWFGPPR